MRAEDQRVGLATQAFMFGFPLVSSVRAITRVAEHGVGPMPPAGYNGFTHESVPPGPLSAFMGVSNDVLVSVAQIDTGPGPMVLTIPPTGKRHHFVQLIDPWLNSFAYLSQRSTGRDGGDYLLLPPDGAGPSTELPTDTDLPTIMAPNRVVVALVRIAYGGPRDLPAVLELQRRLAVRPLDAEARPPEGPPERSKRVCDDLRFWEEFRVWMRAFPPPPVERDHARRFESLGLLTDPSPYVDPDPDLAWSLRSGFRTGRDELERLAQAGRATRGGWISTLHQADFNLDRFGPGVRDDPAWEIPDRVQARIARAMAGRLPMGVVHAYELMTARCTVDADGRRLNGAHSYLLRLVPPTVAAFWSVTMYDEPETYLVANPLDRYSIDSRDDDLVRDSDGSMPILVQNEPPAGPRAGAVNWLPAAPGDFRLVARLYQPGDEVLSGACALPPLHRVG